MIELNEDERAIIREFFIRERKSLQRRLLMDKKGERPLQSRIRTLEELKLVEGLYLKL